MIRVMRRFSSMGPFLLVSTTLHAFPLGWFLCQGTAASILMTPTQPDFSVTFVKDIVPYLDLAVVPPAIESSVSLEDHESSLCAVPDLQLKPILKQEKNNSQTNFSKDGKKHNQEGEDGTLKRLSSATLSRYPITEKNDLKKEDSGGSEQDLKDLLEKKDLTPLGAINIKPATSNQEPTYPIEARESGIEGIVLLRLTIATSGKVVHVEALPPFASPLLQQAAIRAARHWTFHMTGASGPLTHDIPIQFVLD